MAAVIQRIRRADSRVAIALFPRHLHRIGAWRGRLDRLGVSWVLRSALEAYPNSALPAGVVILWDAVGELSEAYGRARAAFVGGSLAPLGGQNFIEPLMNGVIPVIGPSWEDFKWVGEALFTSGLARIGADWRAVADLLIRDLNHPPDRRRVQADARAYFSRRKGGAQEACRLISACLRQGGPSFAIGT